jgi:hypothetical protein
LSPVPVNLLQNKSVGRRSEGILEEV